MEYVLRGRSAEGANRTLHRYRSAQPAAYERFLQRVDAFGKDMAAWQHGTLILDSITFCEIAPRSGASIS